MEESRGSSIRSMLIDFKNAEEHERAKELLAKCKKIEKEQGKKPYRIDKQTVLY